MLYNLIFDILNYEKKVFESKEEKKESVKYFV